MSEIQATVLPPAEPVSSWWGVVDNILNAQYSGSVIAIVIFSLLVGASISVWKGFLRDYLSRFTKGE